MNTQKLYKRPFWLVAISVFSGHIFPFVVPIYEQYIVHYWIRLFDYLPNWNWLNLYNEHMQLGWLFSFGMFVSIWVYIIAKVILDALQGTRSAVEKLETAPVHLQDVYRPKGSGEFQ